MAGVQIIAENALASKHSQSTQAAQEKRIFAQMRMGY
jgi:hypothetical protein